MTTNVIPMFAFNGIQLRGVKIDGEPWFFGIDVVRCLGLDSASTANHYRKLDADERTNVNRVHVGMEPGRPVTLVSRPGLFKLIQRSSKPEAREFDRWVRHEVLPQVMDNGGYVTPDADVKAVAEAAPTNTRRTDLDLMKTVMSAMNAMQERIKELEVEAEQVARAASCRPVANA